MPVNIHLYNMWCCVLPITNSNTCIIVKHLNQCRKLREHESKALTSNIRMGDKT